MTYNVFSGMLNLNELQLPFHNSYILMQTTTDSEPYSCHLYIEVWNQFTVGAWCGTHRGQPAVHQSTRVK